MSQTIHGVVRAALIMEAIENNIPLEEFGVSIGSILTPEKYKRMWKKITGKDITIEQARKDSDNSG